MAYTVMFTPTDSTNYKTAERTITLTVNKAKDRQPDLRDINAGGTPAPTGVIARYGKIEYRY